MMSAERGNEGEQRIERALREASPSGALPALARALKAEGMSQREIYRLFDEYRAKYANDADETKYDAILNTMDVIAGWCSSGDRLFDTELGG